MPDGTPPTEWPSVWDGIVAEDEARAEAAAKASPAPPPRIDPDTPLGDLRVCIQSVLASAAGPCGVGTIVVATDAIVGAAPDAFSPLIQHLTGLVLEGAAFDAYYVHGS